MRKMILGLMVVTSSMFAGDLITFVPGTPAKATEVNDNFSELASRIQALEARLDACNCNGVIFSEDFSDKPTITSTYTLKNGEYFQYDSTNQDFKVKILEEDGKVNKFAFLPTFSKVINKSFEISFDFNLKETSFGMPIGIEFGDKDFENNKRISVVIGGSHDMRLGFSDGTNPRIMSTSDTKLNTWYSVKLSYDNNTKTVDILVSNKSDGSVFFKTIDQKFEVPSFEKIGMGNRTVNLDGTSAEMYYDNIVITNK